MGQRHPLVLLCLAVGARLRLGAQGIPQVAISALLVMIIGSLTRAEYGWLRVSDTLIGAVVGVAVDALVVPPSHPPGARSALAAFAAAQSAVLRALASDLRSACQPERARADLEAARAAAGQARAAAAAVARAEESLHYHPFGRGQRRALARIAADLRSLERSSIEVRGIARTLHDFAGAGAATAAHRSVSALLAHLADAVDAFCAQPDGAPGGAFAAARAQAEDAIAAAERAAVQPGDWVWLGAVLTDGARMLRDRAVALPQVPDRTVRGSAGGGAPRLRRGDPPPPRRRGRHRAPPPGATSSRPQRPPPRALSWEGAHAARVSLPSCMGSRGKA